MDWSWAARSEAVAGVPWTNDRARPSAAEMKWRSLENDMYSKASVWIYNGHEPTQPRGDEVSWPEHSF